MQCNGCFFSTLLLHLKAQYMILRACYIFRTHSLRSDDDEKKNDDCVLDGGYFTRSKHIQNSLAVTLFLPSLSLSRIVAFTISICVDVCYISICLFFVVAHCHSIYLLHVLNDFSSSHLLHRFVVSISICFFLRFVCGSFLNLILPLHEMGTLRKLRIIHPRNYIHIEARDIVHTHLTREKKAPWNISSPSLAWYCKCQPFFAHWW